MAISIASDADGLTRSATYLNLALNWTRVAWVRCDTLPPDYQTLWWVGSSNFTAPWVGSFIYADGLLDAEGDKGSGFVTTGSSPIVPTGVWGFAAVRYTASTTTVDLFLNAVLVASMTLDLSAVPTQPSEAIGRVTGNGGFSIAYEGVYQRALTTGQLQTQMLAQSDAVGGALRFTAFADADDLGTWTLEGTVETVEGPSAPAGFEKFLLCDEPLPPGPPVTPGQPNTLIYDTLTKRFSVDYSAKTAINVRLEEPGAGVYNQVCGGDDGALYQFDDEALIDDDTPIAWNVWTPWVDGGAPRLQKQWGDAALNVDPGGSLGGILVQPVVEDGTTGPSPTTLGVAASGRASYPIELNAGNAVIARNLGLRISGEMVDGDAHRPVLFWWEPSFIPKGDDVARRATDWDDLGYVGAKFIQGVIIRANTYGQAKQVSVQRANATGPETMITLAVSHDGEAQIAYPLADVGWTPFIGELVRLMGADSIPWQLLGYRFVWEPAPELATEWTTQFTAAGAPGYLQFRDLVVGYEASATVIFGLTYDDGTEETYELPSTGGVYRREYVVLRSGKGKSARFRWTSDEPFRLYKKDISLRLHAWGTSGAYAPLNPFGGPSYESGAQI